MNEEIRIRYDIRPGDIGTIIKMHGEYYAKNNGFDIGFEPYVAIPLSKFALRRDERERIWIVESGNDIEGCIAIVRYKNRTAQLRWYLLKDEIQGKGIGRDLMAKALEFAKKMGYSRMILWTVNEQAKAIKIYEKNGFKLTKEKGRLMWGKQIVEQCYEKKL
jgi:GNAT superfamily N-acetyltransferase